jgi:Putative zinc-finger
MMRHIGAEALARFRQGDLSPRRTSRIRAHLDRCERCRALDEDLAGVTTLLADAQPPPIPEHLTARIQTALAAEAARRVALTAGSAGTAAGATGSAAGQHGTEPAGIAGPGAPEVPRDERAPRHERPGRVRRRSRPPGRFSPVALRTMAAAAAVVVVAGGAYEVAQHVGGSSSPTAATHSAAAGSQARPAAGRAPSSGLAQAGPSYGPGLLYQRAGHQASITPVTTGTDFTAASLRSQVSSDLRRYGAGGAAASNARNKRASPAKQPLTFAGIPASTLQGCVDRIAAGQQVLLVEVARYQGAPATVIVTRASAASPEQVWVVGAGCSGTRSDLLAHMALAPGG